MGLFSGLVSGLGGILGGGGVGGLLSLGANAFGGRRKGGTPQQSNEQSGWPNLPQQVRDAYLNQYLPQVMSYNKAGPNQYTQQALQGYGGGLAGLMQDLPGYRNVFDQNTVQPTLDEIQRQVDIQKNALRTQAARSGLGGLLNSNTAIQLSELQGNADRIKAQQLADFNRENTMNALQLRGQTLAELMNAGDYGYNQLSKFAGLLGAFPGGSTRLSVGAKDPVPNTWDRVAGFVNGLPPVLEKFGYSNDQRGY